MGLFYCRKFNTDKDDTALRGGAHCLFNLIMYLLRLLKNLSGTDISQPGSRKLRRPGSSPGSTD